MANIKSAQKRIRQTARRRARNQGAAAHLRTSI
ncbi:MAG: 30S ribosomal protein S20, partial [Thermoanaerobaculia bacterium]